MYVKIQMPLMFKVFSVVANLPLTSKDLLHIRVWLKQLGHFARGKKNKGKCFAIRPAAKMRKDLDVCCKCTTMKSFLSLPFLLVLDAGMDQTGLKARSYFLKDAYFITVCLGRKATFEINK